jgi:hypothetical protein
MPTENKISANTEPPADEVIDFRNPNNLPSSINPTDAIPSPVFKKQKIAAPQLKKPYAILIISIAIIIFCFLIYKTFFITPPLPTHLPSNFGTPAIGNLAPNK